MRERNKIMTDYIKKYKKAFDTMINRSIKNVELKIGRLEYEYGINVSEQYDIANEIEKGIEKIKNLNKRTLNDFKKYLKSLGKVL